mgnify:CR=1 FL=1
MTRIDFHTNVPDKAAYACRVLRKARTETVAKRLAAGGGAQLVSLGGMNFASGVSINGGQLIALKEIAFAANGEGLHGTSIISGDTVSGTSNMRMGLCRTGMEGNLSLDYFRMVE